MVLLSFIQPLKYPAEIVGYDHATGQSREIPGEVCEHLMNRQ